MAAFGVPTVFVPYPYAADDHQRENVAELEQSGVARVVEDTALDGSLLEEIIVSLLDDASQRERMAEGMRRWAKLDAADAAAQQVLDLVGGHSEMATRQPQHASGVPTQVEG